MSLLYVVSCASVYTVLFWKLVERKEASSLSIHRKLLFISFYCVPCNPTYFNDMIYSIKNVLILSNTN